MEQDILEQLYFGRIVPWENRNDKTPEMEQCSEQVLEIKISCKTHKFCPESLCNI